MVAERGKRAAAGTLPAAVLGEQLKEGALRAADVAEAVAARIAADEADLGAWAWHDDRHLAAQAEAIDAHRGRGRPLGALHGLPVGLKDIIDTARIPTENGTAIDAGRIPERDAWLVARLKAAGALIAGKTATTELAYTAPAATKNPAAPGRTPGGSSSGSAAAVAAGHVPLAVGTQTGGSVIRPAAFCGVVGYKPSFGAIPRSGVLAQSPSLDTVGVFARSVEDAALLAEVLFGHDPGDRATAPAPAPRLLATTRNAPPLTPTFALVRPPGWDGADEEMRGAIDELAEVHGPQCFAAPLGLESTGDPLFNGLWTLVGTPAITIPAFVSGEGLPMGLQIVGPRGDDARLLRTARWLEVLLAEGRLHEEAARWSA